MMDKISDVTRQDIMQRLREEKSRKIRIFYHIEKHSEP